MYNPNCKNERLINKSKILSITGVFPDGLLYKTINLKMNSY